MQIFSFFKSTRSIAVILSFALIFTVLIYAGTGHEMPDAVLALVTGTTSTVIGSYFLKRDETKE